MIECSQVRSKSSKSKLITLFDCETEEKATFEFGWFLEFLWNYRLKVNELSPDNKRRMADVVEAVVRGRGLQLVAEEHTKNRLNAKERETDQYWVLRYY